MPEKKNLVPFPRSAKKRKQLLQQAESLKQRRLTRFRSLVGVAAGCRTPVVLSG